MKSTTRRFKRWFLPLFMAKVVEGFALRLILLTCRIEIRNLDNFKATAKKGPCILVCWHNRLTLFSYAIRRWASEMNFSAVVSKSRDGEMLASIIESAPNIQAIRVPHDAKHKALRQIIQTLKEQRRVLLVTPDGPRGPRYQCKPGAVVASEVAGAQIIGVTWSASRFWQLSTWDRLLIPRPFTRIIISLSDPIDVSAIKGVDAKCKLLDEGLLAHDAFTSSLISDDKSSWPN